MGRAAALVERVRVRQGERPGRRYDGALPGPAVRKAAGHALPRLEPRSADHGAREVDAERERGLRLQLVLPLAQQQVGEGDADRVHVDQHVVRAGYRLVHLAHHHAGGACRGEDLDGAHAPIMPLDGRGGRASAPHETP